MSLFICYCINLISFLRQPLSFHILVYLLTYLLTYSMEQSPSGEANRFSASQEIPSILWNPKIHYHIHKCLPPAPILSQIDPIHASTSQFLKIHICLGLPSGLFPSGLCARTLYRPLPSPISATCHSHSLFHI